MDGTETKDTLHYITVTVEFSGRSLLWICDKLILEYKFHSAND